MEEDEKRTMTDIPLKEYLEKMVAARFEAHQSEHQLLAQAIVSARDVLDVRLDGMNEFRDQLEHDSKEYLRRETYDRAHDVLVERLEEAKRRLVELEKFQKTAVTVDIAEGMHVSINAKIDSNTKRLYELEASNEKECARRNSQDKNSSRTAIYIGMVFTGIMAFISLLLSLAEFVKK